jgi:hypothetical protein
VDRDPKLIFIDLLVPLGPLLRHTDGAPSGTHWRAVLAQGVAPTFLAYWLFSLIPGVGTLLYALIMVPLSAWYHVRIGQLAAREAILAVYLRYFVVIIIGFGGLWSFIGHTLLADQVAAQIGWPTGSPFQTELAFYHLGFGIAGLMSIWFGGNMLVGLVISKSIFWYGAAFVHIRDAIAHQNYAPLNIGVPLIGDIVLPTVLLTLLVLTHRSNRT